LLDALLAVIVEPPTTTKLVFDTPPPPARATADVAIYIGNNTEVTM
jgi:hypothetical protein